jgi:HEAT repeat protein
MPGHHHVPTRIKGVVAACFAMTGVLTLHATADDFTETATRHLMQSVESQPDGTHLARLSSLRLLRDPAMKDLFYKLLQHEDWLVQVHALLGLAEIEDGSRLDPWLVTQVDPQAREQIIANAIDMNLIDQEGMQKILEWDHLESGNRLLLMAELQNLELEVDQEKLESLANDNDLVIASVASLLLARDGELAPLSNISARLAGASPSERIGVLQRLIEVIRIYEITSATPWLNEMLDTDIDNDDLTYWGTFTLMSLNPELGRPHWNRMVGPSPTYRMRIMGALQFLEAKLAPDADARARLRAGDDPLINRILDTAEAMENDQSITVHVKELIDTGHPRVIDWAMRSARDFKPAEAIEIYGYFIDLPETTRRRSLEVTQRSQAISAMATLLDIAPEQALQRLRDAEDDSMLQQTLLMGSLQSQHPELPRTIASLRRIGSSRPDSLALLLLARNGEQLSPTDLQQLGRISAGGGQLTDTLQIQAAWLYLKHTDGLQAALVRLAPAD